MKTYLIFLILFISSNIIFAEDGHNLWLRNKNTGNVTVVCSDKSATTAIAVQELNDGWQGQDGATITLKIKKDKTIKTDGFKLSEKAIQANTPAGLLYGVYELLRRQQTGEPIVERIYNPSYQVRTLNHWDNLDGTIERGYSGLSIFWGKDKNLLAFLEQRASISDLIYRKSSIDELDPKQPKNYHLRWELDNPYLLFSSAECLLRKLEKVQSFSLMPEKANKFHQAE